MIQDCLLVLTVSQLDVKESGQYEFYVTFSLLWSHCMYGVSGMGLYFFSYRYIE